MFNVDENTIICFGPGSQLDTHLYIDYGGQSGVTAWRWKPEYIGPPALNEGPQNSNDTYPTPYPNYWPYSIRYKNTENTDWIFSGEQYLVDNYSVEVWIYYSTRNTIKSCPIASMHYYDIGTGAFRYWEVGWEMTNGFNFLYQLYDSFAQPYVVTYGKPNSSGLNLNTWYHLVFQKSTNGSSNNYNFFINGVKVIEYAGSSYHNFTDFTTFNIGGFYSNPNNQKITMDFNDAYIGKFAYHKIVRYTSDFDITQDEDFLRYQQLL